MEKVTSFFRKKTGVETPQEEVGDKSHKAHIETRARLIELEKRISFSYELEEWLSEDERKVDHMLKRLKGQIKNDDYNTIVHDFYDHLVRIPPTINFVSLS